MKPIKQKINYSYAIALGLLGLAIIVVSLLLLINQETFWTKLFDVIGYLFLFGALRTWISFYRYREKQLFIRAIINSLAGLFLIIYPQIPATLAFVLMALYITANGVVKLISYVTLRSGQASKRLYFLTGAVILIFIGLSILVGQLATIRMTMIFLGIYGLLLGFTYLSDGIASILPAKRKESLKKRLRISPPILVTAFLPRMMLDYINERLATHPDTPLTTNLTQQKTNVEILVHVTEKGFGTMGHCDISIKGNVLSFANYDRDTIRLYEAVGDGVLGETPLDIYIPFCLNESQKTIFSYGLSMNDKQLEQMELALEKIMQPAYEWHPKAWYNKDDCLDYASKLYLESKGRSRFYKFKSGPFKKYFVLGANCVELVEAILGKTGLDIIHFNGIVSPGAYQNYLEKEFHRRDGLVIARNVYRPKNPVAKFSLFDILR